MTCDDGDLKILCSVTFGMMGILKPVVSVMCDDGDFKACCQCDKCDDGDSKNFSPLGGVMMLTFKSLCSV